MLVLTVPSASGRTSVRQGWCGQWSCCWGITAEGRSGRTGSRCSPPTGCCSPDDCKRGQKNGKIKVGSGEGGFRTRWFTGNRLSGVRWELLRPEMTQFEAQLWKCNLWPLLCYVACNWGVMCKNKCRKRCDGCDSGQFPVRRFVRFSRVVFQ